MNKVFSEIINLFNYFTEPKKKKKSYTINQDNLMGVTINGKHYKCKGGVSIINGVVTGSNGVVCDCNLSSDKVFNISCDSDITSIETDTGDVSINGDVSNGIKTQTGDVRVAYKVTGDVKSQTGDIEIGSTVGGNVRTQTGDIEYKR